MARRNEDRLDVMARVFDELFNAHDMKDKAKDAAHAATEECYDQCLMLLAELARKVRPRDVSDELGARLRKFVELDDLGADLA